MASTEQSVGIIGAGISGLIAAKVLEDSGISPTIIEATDRVGGRVKTDLVDGYQLDHGFQVLLTDYPAAKKHLDYSSLHLQKFLPGSQIFHNGGGTVIGDAFRKFGFLFSTLFSSAGSFGDKLKVLKLNKQLKQKSLEAIFAEKEKTTLQYLKDFGFSDKMIRRFFKPFFTGIFLETELQTSSRMFEFVYKMFGEGYAALPKGGIEKIPQQLASQLKSTEIHFNQKVEKVQDNKVYLDNKKVLTFDFIIIATEPSQLIPNMKDQETEWKSCQTLYFTAPHRFISKALIGLIADEDSLANNIFYHNSLKTDTKGEKELLSVTVVKDHNLSDADLVKKVQNDLEKYCGIDELEFLKLYHIPKALPDLKNVQYELAPSETQLTHYIFLAGDTQLNGSLNAAMLSGEKAATGVLEKMGVITYSG
jgi:protoporphyrinogen oxidase